jgi:nucleotide-binding universal stress UspA family protein
MGSAPRTLVVPLLGSPDPERAVATACELAGGDGTVDAVVVVEISPLLPLDARMDAEEASARMLLARARSVADAFGVRFVPHVVRAREAASAILALAEQEDAEIVVVERDGRRRRRAERRLLRKAGDRALVVAA